MKLLSHVCSNEPVHYSCCYKYDSIPLLSVFKHPHPAMKLSSCTEGNTSPLVYLFDTLTVSLYGCNYNIIEFLTLLFYLLINLLLSLQICTVKLGLGNTCLIELPVPVPGNEDSDRKEKHLFHELEVR